MNLTKNIAMQLVNEEGILFKVFPTPMKGKDGKPLFYVRPSCDTASVSMFDDYCAQEYHMQKSEMQRALNVFMQAAGEFLAKGYNVMTPFGSFSLRLGLKREISNPDEVTGDDVVFEGIDFHYNKEFLNDLEKWKLRFRRTENPNTRELLQDTQKIDQMLQDLLRKQGYATVNSFAYQAHLTYYSAKKQLEAWTKGDSPRLLKTKMGQQYIYTEI